jgi:hypothetical protein
MERFAFFQLSNVSDARVVDAFFAGTTNQQLFPGPTSVTRLFDIANKYANRELGEDSSPEPSRQERSPRFRSKSPLWHPNGSRV